MKNLRAILPYLRPYRRPMAVGLLLVLVSTALMLWTPDLIGRGIDALGRPGATGWTVARYAGLSVLATVLGGIARYYMRLILNGVSRRVETDLRNGYFRHLLHLDAPFYGRTPTGEIISLATNDLGAVRMVAGPAIMYLVNMIATALFALTLMVWINPRMTLFALFPMLALPVVTLGFSRVIHERFERIQSEFGILSSLAQENLAGVRIVKAYAQEEAQAERFRELSEGYMERNMSLARASSLFQPLLGLFGGVALAVVLLLGGRAIVRGEITVGEFVEFNLYLAMLSWPMISLGWVINLFQRGAASMGRVARVLDTRPAVREPEAPARPERVRGEIEFRGVSFRYPGTDRMVLRGVSFHVPPGATLAVVGPTGSGKSTVAALLARLYDPTEGEVLLDGIPVRRWPLDRLRAALGVVPQDAFLFSATLRENLALGFDEPDPARAEERIRAAARVAQLDDTVAGFPAGYDTLLGERGINLSGGQKQRATLARALARDPEVLVLDDALSAVDTHTETEILRGLREVLAGRTSVIVSHRVTAVMNADRIVVLDGGEVAEVGTHAELLRAGGTYAALQRRQLLAEDLDGDPVLAPPEHGV
ncbi:MAG TPA: ABC transporter ATP-binding protein [Longimicrobiaceae bacterium]|nr:ABC transporter ATP-binding protein [Longimicrobiaceae bacterium]